MGGQGKPGFPQLGHSIASQACQLRLFRLNGAQRASAKGAVGEEGVSVSFLRICNTTVLTLKLKCRYVYYEKRLVWGSAVPCFTEFAYCVHCNRWKGALGSGVP